MAPVKVFGPAISTNVSRVLLCLEEVGVGYEVVDVNFAAGEHKGPEHLERNIPAFQDGGLMLFAWRTSATSPTRSTSWPRHMHRCSIRRPAAQILIVRESRAISRYVLRKFKTPDAGTNNLLRDGDLEGSALVDAWLDVEALLYEPAVHAVFVQHRVVPALGGVPDEKVIGESVEKLRKVLEVYEARLGERRYLAGDDVSLADLSHFPYTHYFMGMPYAAVFDAFPRVRSWWQDLMARPAVQRVAAMMDGQ